MKIDVSTIPGYETMSAEEKLAALEAYEFQADGDAAREKHYKDLITKANGEAAAYKKQLQERMSAEEKEKMEREEAARKAAEEQAEKDRKYEELLKENSITKLTAKYVALGWAAELAEATAKAQYDGDTDTVFANMKSFADAHEKEILANAAKNQPKPGGNAGGDPVGDDVSIAKQLGAAAAKNTADAAKVLETMIK